MKIFHHSHDSLVIPTSLNVSLQNLVISEVLPTLLGPAVTRVTLDIVNTDDDEDDGTTEHPRVIPDIVQRYNQEEIDFTQSFQLCHSMLLSKDYLSPMFVHHHCNIFLHQIFLSTRKCF